MPYITDQERRDVNGGIFPKTAGQLNYFLCQSILGRYFRSIAGEGEGWEQYFINVYQMYLDINGFRYQQCNDIAGAVLNSRLEFVMRGKSDDYAFGLSRMKAAYGRFYEEMIYPYEQKKCAENGDIFNEDLPSRSNEGIPELQLPSVPSRGSITS